MTGRAHHPRTPLCAVAYFAVLAGSVTAGCGASDDGQGRADGCDAFDRLPCTCPGGALGFRACAIGGVCRCDLGAAFAHSLGSGAALPTAAGVIPFPGDRASYVFAEDIVRTYEVELAPEDLARIDAQPRAEEYVPATLRFEGREYGPIGLRYKGSVGAFRPPCTRDGSGAKVAKCSVKLSFNWLDGDGSFYGLRKLNFHAMNNDPSMLRDRLAYRLFRDIGAPAPRAVHALLRVNGEPWGLFALVEQVDGRFTRSRFADGGEGNLYKEVWPRYEQPEPYLAALKTNEDEGPSVAGMQAFKRAIDAGPDAMATWLDMNHVMHLIAADRVMANDDGLFHFWCAAPGQGNNVGESGNHNYYWYEGRSAPRFWLIPWDMDLAFDGTPGVRLLGDWFAPGPCDCRNGRQTAPSCDPLIQHWTEWLWLYDKAVDAFISGPFRKERVDGMLDEWIEWIAPHVAESAAIDGAPDERSWRRGIAQLKDKIDELREHGGLRY